MEICSKTLKTHNFKLEILVSGVIERCDDCFKIFYHLNKNIEEIDLTTKKEN